jgi:hypothetical protein
VTPRATAAGNDPAARIIDRITLAGQRRLQRPLGDLHRGRSFSIGTFAGTRSAGRKLRMALGRTSCPDRFSPSATTEPSERKRRTCRETTISASVQPAGSIQIWLRRHSPRGQVRPTDPAEQLGVDFTNQANGQRQLMEPAQSARHGRNIVDDFWIGSA